MKPPAVAGFQPIFYTTAFAATDVQPSASAAALPESPQDDAAQSPYYSPDRHGEFDAFLQSTDCQRIYKRMRADFDVLVAFMRAHAPSPSSTLDNEQSRADHARAQFDRFITHLDSDFFGSMIKEIHVAGLPALHEAALAVTGANADVWTDDKVRAIERLADGMTVCAAGVTTNLCYAGREMLHAGGGMRGKIWQAKENAVEALLTREVGAWFDKQLQRQQHMLRITAVDAAYLRRNYAWNEIHHVSAFSDRLADRLGLVKRNDPVRMPMPMPPFSDEATDSDISKWQGEIVAGLKPSLIAATIADQMLTAYRQDVQAAGIGLNGAGNMVGALADVARRSSERLGLPADDTLNLYRLVSLDGADYQVRDDSSVLALEMLSRMDKLGLIKGQPVYHGHWTDPQDGQIYALVAYEELGWKVALPPNLSGDPPSLSWTDADGWEVQALDLKDLHAWSGSQAGAAGIPPQGALRHVIGKTLPADCRQQFLAGWFTEQASHWKLRDRMGLGLAAYGAHLETWCPRQLEILVMRCEGETIQLPELYQSYKEQPGEKILPPVKLVLNCMLRTYYPDSVKVLKHWPPHETIDRWLRIALRTDGSLLNKLEYQAFKAARRWNRLTDSTMPAAWPSHAGASS